MKTVNSKASLFSSPQETRDKSSLWFPLHLSQQEVFFDQATQIESPHYNVGGYVALKGKLNLNSFYEAVKSLPLAFDVYKAKFNFKGEKPQCIFDSDSNKIELNILDFSQSEQPEKEALIWMQDRFNLAFDLNDNLLFEQTLLKISEDEHWWYMRYHHLITDGYGFAIFQHYVANQYNNLLKNNILLSNLNSNPYSQEALNSQEYLKTESYNKDEQYWKTSFNAIPEPLIKKKYSFNDSEDIESGRLIIEIPEEKRKQWDAITQNTNTTIQQLTQAALIIYFGKTDNRKEIVLGTTLHKRRNKTQRNVVGMFSGMLPFKGKYSPDQLITELLSDIKKQQRTDYRYQNFPISHLNRSLKLLAHGRDQLFEVVVNYATLDFNLNFEGIKTGNFELSSQKEKVPLQFWWRDYGSQQQLELRLDFRKDYFTKKEAQLLSKRILFIMDQMVGAINKKVSTIEIIPQSEKTQILNNFATSENINSAQSNLVSYFEDIVSQNPNEIALTSESKQFTYKDLNKKVNYLAHYLIDNKLNNNSYIGVCLDRSVEMIIGILGVLKAGCAYVPIDPEFPEERINFLIEDTQIDCLITNIKSDQIFKSEVKCIEIDKINSTVSPNSESNPNVKVKHEDDAYVIYTSGSTGKPKGVLISHKAVINLIDSQTKNYGIGKSENILLFSNYVFDASVEQIFLSLLNGNNLVLISKNELLNTENFFEFLMKHQISHLDVTPGFLENITYSSDLPIKRIVVGGEVCPLGLAKKWGKNYPFYNAYGPTEATVSSLIFKYNTEEIISDHLPIGKPVANSKVLVLNQHQEILPVGHIGELYISGIGLAKGYLNRPEITKDKFIYISNEKGIKEKFYKTGDLVSWLTNGNLEYIGRIDEQVKIRGHRIELGEIEAVLQQSPIVKLSVVLKAKTSNQDNLVAYIVPNTSFDKAEIIKYLESRLPKYMVPSIFVELENMPLNSSGKIDKKALPEPDFSLLKTNNYKAPENDAQHELVKIWHEILQIENKIPIGTEDNFFELGGHSLLATRLISNIRKQLNTEITIKDVFSNPTIAGLSEIISKVKSNKLPEITIQEKPKYIPLSFSQERLWFIDQLEGSKHYHMPGVFRFKGSINQEILEAAFNIIINRHEILRTVIKENDGIAYQETLTKNQWRLNTIEGVASKQDLSNHIDKLSAKSFDLSKDHLIHAHLISESKNENLLLIVIHHIAADGWSLSVLINELITTYNKLLYNKDNEFSPLPLQYADYSIWQRKFLEGAIINKQLNYWENKLKGVKPLHLPTDYPRSLVDKMKGHTIQFSIHKELTTQIQYLSKQTGSTLFMTMLAAFKVLLFRYSGQTDFCVGTAIANRQQEDMEKLIGFFVNTLAIRSSLEGNPKFSELLKQVKNSTLEAYANQDAPFDKVVDRIDPERELNRNPLFQVMFVLQNTPDIPELKLGDVALTLEPLRYEMAKFDLTFTLEERHEGIEVEIEYSQDLFNEATIQRLFIHYKNILSALVANPNEYVESISILDKQEEQLILKEFNKSKTENQIDKTVIDLFEEQVKRHPYNLSVVFKEREYNFQELNNRANQIAHYLNNLGINKGDYVALCIPSSYEMMAGILGILKTGAAYVPIDATHPKERINFILEDIQASYILTNSECENLFQDKKELNVISIDSNRESIEKEAITNPNNFSDYNSIAYIIYTSGSTGKPKGTLIKHNSLFNYLQHCKENYIESGSTNNGTFVHLSNTFDASVSALFSPLISGKSIVISANSALEVFNDDNLLKYAPYDFIKLTPAHLQLLKPLIENDSKTISERYVLGGEALQKSDFQYFIDKKINIEIINEYGPTEATVGCSTYTFKTLENFETTATGLLIGKPIINSELYVIDQYNNPQPIGVVGELCIGGPQLAEGYLNRKDLTEEKFIQHPFKTTFKEKLYKTGDLAKWRPDGNLEFISRKDEQLKINGYRIEPGEIEHSISYSDSISASCIVVKEELNSKKLIHYFVPEPKVINEKAKQLYYNQVDNWQDLYIEEYKDTTHVKDEEFNVTGWGDSFTGGQIPDAHMQEWLDDIIKTILKTKPKNVLEIGCGTGLIFYKLADYIDEYTGFDLSITAINHITSRIAKGEKKYPRTNLAACPAHKISIHENTEIDTIIINSVIQYFPGIEYLSEIIRNSISYLKGNGKIIVGDVRHFGLLKDFKRHLQFNKATDKQTIKDFEWQVERSILNDKELSISPEFFYNLQKQFPEIQHIDIDYKEGEYINEMSLYRYNVVIHFGEEKELIKPEWKEWGNHNSKSFFSENKNFNSELIAISDVPNPRLSKESLLLEGINKNNILSVKDLRQFVENAIEENEVFNFLKQSKELGFSYRMLVNNDPLKTNIILEKTPGNKLIANQFKIDQEKKFSLANIPLFTEASLEIQKEIKEQIARKLPEYMLPAKHISLQSLPITSNGKVDRKFLSQLETAINQNDKIYQAPESQLEITLAEIWSNLLHVEKVGVNDNFFELGGDSIITIQVVSRAKKAGYQIEPKDIFQYQTIAELAIHIANSSKKETIAEQGILTGESDLLPIQHWFLSKNYDQKSWFNQSLLLEINKDVTADHIEKTLKALLQQHDALRFKYVDSEGKWIQSFGSEEGKLEKVNLNNTEEFSLENSITKICHELQQKLAIEQGKLVSSALIYTPEYEANNRLFIAIHHLAADGVSWRVLLEQFESALDALKSNQSIDFGSKTTSYREWVQSLSNEKNIKRFYKEQKYWQSVLSPHQPFPVDYLTAKTTVKDLSTLTVGLEKSLTNSLLQSAHKAYNTEINDLLLAALHKTIGEWSGKNDLVIGLEGHGRETLSKGIDLSETVGWFTNLFPVALNSNNFDSLTDLIRAIKEQLRNIPNKGMGYGILKYLHPNEEIRKTFKGNPFDIIFNYLGQTDNAFKSSKWFSRAKEDTGQSTSNEFPFDHKLEINASISEGKLTFDWRYSQKEYREETISNLLNTYVQNLKSIIEHCQKQKVTNPTPSDYGLNQWINYKELESFLEDVSEGKNINAVYPLSPMQEGLLFHGLYDKNSESYVEQTCIDLLEKVDLKALEASWKEVVKNHSILRSAFDTDTFKVPIQIVYEKVSIPFDVIDFSFYDDDEKAEKIEKFLIEDKQKGFNFDTPPLLRITILKVSPVLYKMVWTSHHIIVDGWTSAIIIEELLNAYEDFARFNTPFQKEEDNYQDFIKFLQANDKEEAKTFWTEYLSGFESASLLPFISSKANRTKASVEAKELILSISKNQTEKIKSFSKSNHFTVNTLLQGVWALLLSRYTAQEEVAFGTIVSGRPGSLKNAEKRVGLYINTIPLKSKVDPEEKITNWLNGIQISHTEARAFQYNGLNEIQNWSGIKGDLFDSLFVYENYPIGNALANEWLLKMDNVSGKEQTNYPLTIIAATINGELNIKFNYNAELLNHDVIEMIKNHFEMALSGIIDQPQQKIGAIEVLSENALNHLVFDLNQTDYSFPNTKTVTSLFEEQVLNNPNEVAIALEGETLTYWELDKKANQFAHYLRKKEVLEGAFVGICLERSFEMIIGILGILKAGGVYVPIDPNYPKERIEFLLNDANTEIVITSNSCKSIPGIQEYKELIVLDDIRVEIEKETNIKIPIKTSADSLVYMMYTSGSTGKPKGVLTKHEGITRLIFNKDFEFLNEKAVLYQYAPIAFDAATFEIWGALLKGGKLVLSSPENKSLDTISEEIKINGVNILWLTAGLFHEAVNIQIDLFENLDYILAGGDSIRPESVQRLLEHYPNLTFINGYGPTESTTFAVLNKINDVNNISLGSNIIGQPISNTKAIILQPNTNKIVPFGGLGELCLSGPGLADGYHNKKKLSQEKFIKNPYLKGAHQTLYRTGDLVRWTKEGKLEFLGRLDQQIKLRGYRVEIGEIESVLLQAPKVDQCAVIVKELNNSDKQLIAFVVVNGDFDKTEIQKYLASSLPVYMIPAFILEIEEIPLTANGKVNRKILSETDLGISINSNFIAPRNETEEQLSAIWRRLLNIDRVSVEDNFFELGGHSLLVTRMVSEIKNEFSIKLEIKDLFELTDIASISQHLLVQQSNTLQEGEEYEMIEL